MTRDVRSIEETLAQFNRLDSEGKMDTSPPTFDKKGRKKPRKHKVQICVISNSYVVVFYHENVCKLVFNTE